MDRWSNENTEGPYRDRGPHFADRCCMALNVWHIYGTFLIK